MEGENKKVRVVIIDDDTLVALSLKTILEVTGGVVVEATGQDGSEALELYNKYKPDVLVMDIRMKHMTGLEAAATVMDCNPDARILLLTTFNDDEYIVKALKLGVKGYILKQDFEGIEPAVLAVAGGQTVFGGEVVGRIPTILSSGESAGRDKEVSGNSLNDSEKESRKDAIDWEAYDIGEKEIAIIELVAEGLNNKEIAGKLFLSEGTVRNYLSQILEKLELRDRTQLAVFYLTL